MVRPVRHVPGRGGLVVLAGVLWLLAGCELLGIGTAEPPRPEYEVADKPPRATLLSGASSSSDGASQAAVSLTPVVQVRPPTVKSTQTQAGHVSWDPETGRLHVAYKLAGTAFGGGVDVLDVQRGAPAAELVEGRRRLRSRNVDVVAVRYGAAENALYAAGAVTTDKRRLSPAVISRVVPGDPEVQARSKRLSHNVAKGVLLGAASDAVYVPTDENALYRFGPDLEDRSKRTADNAAGFRSAVAQGGQVFVLDQSGRVFETDASTFQGLSEAGRLTDRDFGNGTVARLHADADRLYAALNDAGFALLSPTGASMWKSDPVAFESRYTCVTTGREYLYAGRFDGVIEVYRRPDAIPEQNLERVGTFGPWGGTYGGRLSGAPVNHLQVIGDHLYAASSRDGLVVARIEEQ